MIGLGLLLLQAAPFVASAAPAPPRESIPLDWSVLPPLPYASAPQMTPAYSRYVASEIAAGRCGLTRPADGRWSIRLEIAVLVDAGGGLRRVIPRAMGCPTIEQYAAGLVQGFARGNLSPNAAAAGGSWYRTAITFEWAA